MILCDINMQCECVAFPCKEYIFIKDKAQGVGQSTLRYITERDVNVFDSPGNSADLTLIEAVRNIMKKKYVTLPNNKKKKL